MVARHGCPRQRKFSGGGKSVLATRTGWERTNRHSKAQRQALGLAIRRLALVLALAAPRRTMSTNCTPQNESLAPPAGAAAAAHGFSQPGFFMIPVRSPPSPSD